MFERQGNRISHIKYDVLNIMFDYYQGISHVYIGILDHYAALEVSRGAGRRLPQSPLWRLNNHRGEIAN
jgi:hypothetical protein